MLNNINKFLPPRQLRIPLVGLFLILGVVAERSKPVLSSQMAYLHTSTATAPEQLPTYTWMQRNSSLPSESSTVSSATLPNNIETVPTTTVSEIEPQTPAKNVKVAPRSKLPKQDGIYLYGQSPKPGQIGQGYIIFEKRQGNVIGALYMPSSELSCFNGTLDSSGELAMTVSGPSGEGSQTQVAANDTLPRVMEDEPSTYAHSVVLQEYYPINSVSADDSRILQMCKQGSRE